MASCPNSGQEQSECEPSNKKAKVQEGEPPEFRTASSTKKLQIYVKTPDGKVLSLLVDPEDEVVEIKSLISKKVGIPFWKMDLRPEDFIDNGMDKMDDDRPIRWYEVIDGSVIQLAEKVRVHVRTVSGDTIASLLVSPFDSACRVKYEALEMFNKLDYWMSNTSLLMNNEVLCMELPMSVYNVQNGSELTVVVHQEVD